MAVLQPMMVPTAAFPSVGFPDVGLGKKHNLLTHRIIHKGFSIYKKQVNEFRSCQLNLPLLRGNRVYLPGAGPRPIPHKKLDINNLEYSIKMLTQNVSMIENAKRLKQALASENGIQTAIQFIEKITDSVSLSS